MDIDQALADRVRAGSVLTIGDLDALAGADVLALGMLADEMRRERAGNTVTFVRVHVWSDADQAVPPNAGEVRLPSLRESLEATTEVVSAARHLAGLRLLTGFSLADLDDRGRDWSVGLVDLLSHLKRAGLDAVAEAPADRLADAAFEASAAAALPVRCLSIGRPLGDLRSSVLARVRALTDRYPGLQTFAPLARVQSTATPTTGYDDVRTVALARLALPAVSRIQVDWAQYGPKLAQVALTFGANDLDRVSAVDDAQLGPRRTPVEDVRRNIAAAGFTAVERDGRG